MATNKSKPIIVAIVGPTASGKSALALKLAKEFNGEIIAADSRTIYKGMNIGTAKPSKAEQELVPHWGLDLVEPGTIFSAYQFKNYAEQKITEIQKRGKLPILVGGTGLYIDSVLFDFEFTEPSESESKKRAQLESLSSAELQNLIKQAGYGMPENKNNRRHLIRMIERKGKTGSKRRLKNDTLIIGILPNTYELKSRIYTRAKAYFTKGLIKESQYLLKKYGQQSIQKAHGIAYIASIKLLNNEIDEEVALRIIESHEWQYARRQRTWFRRNKFIRWFSSGEQAYIYVKSILNN